MASRIFIGGLNYIVEERDLLRLFRDYKYGTIKEVIIKKGFGFVEFDNRRDAARAVYELTGKVIFGRRIGVQYAEKEHRKGTALRQMSRSSRTTQIKYRLVVKHLSSLVSWQELKDYMGQVGEVTLASVLGNSKGLVEFATLSGMKNALEKLNATLLRGRLIQLFVDRARSRSSYSSSSDSSSKSRSRSRSHTRSWDWSHQRKCKSESSYESTKKRYD